MNRILCLVLLLALERVVRAQDDAGFTGELNVVLWEALQPQRSPANLVLDLEARNGRWSKAFGQTLGWVNSVHMGLVDRGRVDGQGAQLSVRLLLAGDQWVREEHHVACQIDLKRQADGRLAGTYTGFFDGQPVSGQATGHIKPVARPVRPGFEPVGLGEHPRVLFRKSDLPRLRDRLKTPLGQALWARGQAIAEQWHRTQGRGRVTSDPILMGVLYQLTGEKRFAEAAQGMVDQYQLDPNAYVTDFGGGSGGCGHAVVAAALAYDLCGEAWAAEYRQEVRQRLAEEVPMLVRYLNCTSHANNHPCSNYYGPAYGAAGIASLVFWMEKGAAPTKPTGGNEKVVVVRAETQAPPPNLGVPVVPFVADQMPAQWLVAALPSMVGGDLLASLGGAAAARPIAGTRSQFISFVDGKPAKTELKFDPLPAAAATAAGVQLAALGAGSNALTAVLYTVLKVEDSSLVGLVRPPGARVWVGGTELGEKGSYRLEPGWYPLLVQYAAENPPATLQVCLAAAQGPALAWRREEAELREALWKLAHTEWEKTGADQRLAEAVEIGYQRVYRHWRLGIGDGGFQAETGKYADIASWYPLAYAALYPNVFGRPASAYPDVTHLMPRRMMQVLFPANGEPPRVQKLNSAVGFRPDFVAAAYPIAPPEFRPGLLWGWNRVCNVTEPATAVRVLDGNSLPPLLAFLHYPLEDKPVAPAQSMPLTWEAPGFGYHCFRNGWQGTDEFIAQAFLKASLISGWSHPNAGSFAIQGLGHQWVQGSDNRIGFRDHEPVVLLPEDDLNLGACGQLLHRQVGADGSGVLSIDLGDVYSAKTVAGRLYDGNLLRLARNFRPSGITGLRSLAFDYSGKSGAPLLLVMVDRIDGGKRRVWQWTLPNEAAGHAKATENGFVIDQGDASMKLTFVTPSKPPIKIGADQVHLGQLGDGHRSFEGTIARAQAAGTGHFFAVATFQRGPAPEIKVQGEGLDAVVTVGTQKVRFDGTKIVLGN